MLSSVQSVVADPVGTAVVVVDVVVDHSVVVVDVVVGTAGATRDGRIPLKSTGVARWQHRNMSPDGTVSWGKFVDGMISTKNKGEETWYFRETTCVTRGPARESRVSKEESGRRYQSHLETRLLGHRLCRCRFRRSVPKGSGGFRCALLPLSSSSPSSSPSSSSFLLVDLLMIQQDHPVDNSPVAAVIVVFVVVGFVFVDKSPVETGRVETQVSLEKY